jgi:hypothetical protein
MSPLRGLAVDTGFTAGLRPRLTPISPLRGCKRRLGFGEALRYDTMSTRLGEGAASGGGMRQSYGEALRHDKTRKSLPRALAMSVLLRQE